MRAPAGRRAAGRGRATSTSAPSWSAPRSPPRGPRVATSRTSTTASRPAAAPCAPRSPSPTKSSSRPITCSPRTCPIAISAKPISTDRPDPNRRQPQTLPRTPRLSRHPRTKYSDQLTPAPRSNFHGRCYFCMLTSIEIFGRSSLPGD